MLPDLETLQELVRTAAREELLPRFADVQRHVKLDGSIVTEVDHAMQRRLQRELARRWPRYHFLGEEMSAEEHAQLARFSETGLWCLDPLDGTSNYCAGIPFFAVSLALLIDGRTEIGLVYDPVRDECFQARRGGGAWLNKLKLGALTSIPEGLRRAIAVVDFKRLAPSLAAKLGADPPYGSQRNFGSSSLEWCWLADSRFHVYLHGGQKLWDYAAGSLILAEAGGRAVTLEGEEVFSLGLAPRSVVAALEERLFHAWNDWMGRNRLS
jgi:myo-inositol-1(or 4)-monophosphatase